MSAPGQNYTIGRGEVHFKDRYLGNSPQVRLERKGSIWKIKIKLDDISEENLALLTGDANGPLKYVAHNPKGRPVNWHFYDVRFTRAKTKLKGDKWQTIVLWGEARNTAAGFGTMTQMVMVSKETALL